MKVKNILVSQPPPADIAKSPYTKLADKYKLNIDYFKFIKIDGIPSSEFRKDRINITDYTAVIFTSRQAVDHFFRIAKDVRANISEDTKYFCLSESTAYYLQNYIQYRKRKIFHGKQTFGDLMEIIRKHADENFLFPCSEIHKQDIPKTLEKEGIKFAKAVIYRTLACDLTSIDIKSYDMLVFFSPSGIKSLFNNFPDFEQGEQLIAVFGKTTEKAAVKAGLKVNISAPSKLAPSMSMAIENYVKETNKRKR